MMTASVGIFHTTEGTSFAGAEAAFKANNSWPHLGWDPRTNEERQYVPFSQTARALRNMSGGVQTNARESDYLPGPDVIQVEIIGFAKDTPNWPDEWKIRLALKVIEWSQRTGIPLEFPYEFQGNTAYGLRGDGRLSNQQWLEARGWLGHQDVPENTHWDPGDIDWLPPLVRFFSTIQPETTVTAPEIHYDVLEDAGPGKVRLAGWAYDPDQPDVTLNIHAHVVVDGVVRIVTDIPAVPRPDVNAVGIPGTHGFDAVVDVLQQVPVSVTVFALDSQGGPASSGGTKSLVIWK
jgi:hypothetical protein